MKALVWFTQDLRIRDNVSLSLACKENEQVQAVYCLDPRQFETTNYGFKRTEKFRAKFLLETLIELRSSLEKINIPLEVIFEKTEVALPNFIGQHAIDCVYKMTEWTSEEQAILQQIKQNTKVQWIENYDQFLFHPEDIPYQNWEQIPEVFTEFRKKTEQLARVRKPVTPPQMPTENYSESQNKIPLLTDLGFEDFETHPNSAVPFKGGELQAMSRLEDYFFITQNLARYKQTRNGLVGADYSSKFSLWLANGSISARSIYEAVKKFERTVIQNEDTYWLIFELIWRDYFKYISLKHQNKIFHLNGILNRPYHWNQNLHKFKLWIDGKTPEPFVNANMIELGETGFMSNRGRQNVASFWAKQWQEDWRIAAAYFESMLIDYDVHSNYGNWIYNAGVGNDPRDRMFNIKRQAEMYDPQQTFQKLWLKES